jgi:hypothetical protein
MSFMYNDMPKKALFWALKLSLKSDTLNNDMPLSAKLVFFRRPPSKRELTRFEISFKIFYLKHFIF